VQELPVAQESVPLLAQKKSDLLKAHSHGGAWAVQTHSSPHAEFRYLQRVVQRCPEAKVAAVQWLTSYQFPTEIAPGKLCPNLPLQREVELQPPVYQPRQACKVVSELWHV